MENIKNYSIRPYARLLTMLGDQLIKDERIALVEIIKNAYDADSDWVKVIFDNFEKDFSNKPNSKIIIEDAGFGMTYETILKHWLNPATPNKAHKRNGNEFTPKGRIIQGEKGIGRFALLKLGKKITITTKPECENFEYVIVYDFTKYDNEFLSEDGLPKDLFLDEINVTVETREPIVFTERRVSFGTGIIKPPNHGTRIEISELKGYWAESKIKKIYSDIIRLEPIFLDISVNKSKFDVYFFLNSERLLFEKEYLEKLNYLLEEKSVLIVKDGKFDDENLNFKFNLNGSYFEISLQDPRITGLFSFRKRFGIGGSILKKRRIECGPFQFGFYVFDFGHNAAPKYTLDREDREIIKPHRVYLYRDGIRVYPYGEIDDDWLRIDQYRGTVAVGYFLSNDQVVGYVNITWKENPNLRDKTNREGLIEEGNATEDFISLIQIFLAYLRAGPYFRYLKENESKKVADIYKNKIIEKSFTELKDDIKDLKTIEKVNEVERLYRTERQYLTRRAEITENLAGVGLSVETASHDIMGIMSKVFTNLDGLIRDLSEFNQIDINTVIHELEAIRGGMGFIESQLKDIQLLFTSAKQKRKSIRILEIVEKVERIYKRSLEKESIKLTINPIGSPLIAKTTDAVLLQLLLNLFDNSIYWLQQTSEKSKKIEITLDGDQGRMIFSDNGPGVQDDDKPYIFEPFYSGKGEDGRGLGLYIARQLLERNDYSIDLSEMESERILPGANFVVSFVRGEEDGLNRLI